MPFWQIKEDLFLLAYKAEAEEPSGNIPQNLAFEVFSKHQ